MEKYNSITPDDVLAFSRDSVDKVLERMRQDAIREGSGSKECRYYLFGGFVFDIDDDGKRICRMESLGRLHLSMSER
ncbi:hypothetical protein ACFL3M_01325 [Patescibacteria group bacterium]